uniref:Ig-like domain-containing protein n=1 Tax=Mola mola TaxID=94237 RepID=A0A3Q3XLZ7_MOLML
MHVTSVADSQTLEEGHTESLTAVGEFTCQTAVEPKVPNESIQIEEKEISTESSVLLEETEQDFAVQIQEGQSVRQSIVMDEKRVLMNELSQEITKSESAKVAVTKQPKLSVTASESKDNITLPKEMTFVIQIPKPSTLNIRPQLRAALQPAVASEQPVLLADIVGKLQAVDVQEPELKDNSATLQIIQLEKADSGVYKCKATNSAGFKETSGTLYVKGCEMKPDNQDVIPGSTVSFKTAFTGTAPLAVKWFREDKEIVTGVRKCGMKSDFARLIITKSGNCVHIISFLVEPPSFVRKLENLSFLVGSEVSLQCILKGSEPMTIFWMIDNHELKEAEHIQITYENNTALLHIIDLQSKHGGKYSCQAQNQAGSQTCSAVLTLISDHLAHLSDQLSSPKCFQKESVWPGTLPQTMADPRSPTMWWRSSGTLTCSIIGRPLPEIKWYRYGKELIQSRKYKMSSDGRNHSLSILTDEQEDEGLYTCRAINEAGEIETSGKLRLQAAPQFHLGFPMKEKYYAGAGTSLRLHVVYIGRPIPQIMWFYGKKPLNPSENVIIENTESYTHLVVRNVQRKTNAGRYKVQLSNVFGTIDTVLRVEIQGMTTHKILVCILLWFEPTNVYKNLYV